MSEADDRFSADTSVGRPGLPVPGSRDALPCSPRLDAIVDAVRRGETVVNWAFDGIYPDAIGQLSARHWTPVDVARRAAGLLVMNDTSRVLDVGAGVGKLCLVGALTTAGRFTGIEQRGRLVELARSAALRYGAHRAEYQQGDLRDIDWEPFDAFYFYNSFGENQLDPADWIDDSVELSRERFERDVAAALARLEHARIGTRVVTYHGLGARPPRGYERVACDPAGSGTLDLWVKVRS